MSGVTFSSGVRSILLSLQNSAALTGAIQSRLATGKKINSALDNPSSYFISPVILHSMPSLRAPEPLNLLGRMEQVESTF